jgi:D-sedoheptulose 7-phosphate isomerase
VELAKAIKKAKRVYICGNGGSAANAIHIANDLISCGIKAHALTADVSTLTAIANDYSYEEIFSRQIRNFGEPGDLLIALSGSGRSANILRAIEAAKEMGMQTASIFGGYNNHSSAADIHIQEGADMQAAERHQITIGHRAMKWLKSS